MLHYSVLGRDFVLLVVPTGGCGAVLFVKAFSFFTMFLVAPNSLNMCLAEGIVGIRRNVPVTYCTNCLSSCLFTSGGMLWLLICIENVFFVWTCSYAVRILFARKLRWCSFSIFFFVCLGEATFFVINVASIESGDAQSCNIMLKLNLQGKHLCETQYQSKQYVLSVLEFVMICWFSTFFMAHKQHILLLFLFIL